MAMDSLTIPALPATYAGIKFRSRLEARWAYYFDLLGIPWKYEPDGYALKSGNYLPDFKCFDFFVEVKPTEGDLEKAAPKLADLSKVTRSTVFCVVDDPSVKPQKYWSDGKESGAGIFSHYAFQSKGWTFPNVSEGYEEGIDIGFAERAQRLQFNRGGIAEVDYEILIARNEVIRKRREAHKELVGLEGEAWKEHIRSKIDPLNKRLSNLDKLAFPLITQWRAA